jgi:iron complex outermembrane receptor protein
MVNQTRYLRFGLAIISSHLMLCALACRAEENTTPENIFYQDVPTVLTASRLSQPLSETPSAVTVINRAMIKASGFRSIPEILRMVPGMYVGFADANRPVVTLHGSADEWSHRMQVLIDGRSIYLPPSGTVNWADLPILTEDVERIEVVRGPSSASHGANSFYGVINIITRDPLSQHSDSVSATVGNAADASARFGRLGEIFDYRISVGRRSDQGYDNAILNDHNSTSVLNLRSNFHPNASDSIDFQLGNSSGVYGLGTLGRPEEAFRDTSAQNGFQQINWLHIWPGNDETQITISHATDRTYDPYLCINLYTCQGYYTVLTPPIPISQGFIQQHVSSERSEMELQNTQHLGASNRLVWGGVVRRDYADFPVLFAHSYEVDPWQFFAHDEWLITQSSVMNIGTMFEEDGMGNKTNSPQASFNYHLSPQNSIRFGISTATHSPAMFEAFMLANNTILGGPYVPPVSPLRPEKILSKEIGYLGDFRSIGIMVDTRVYVEKVNDMIWWDNYVTATSPSNLKSSPNSYKNLLSAEYSGVEVTFKYHWDEGHSFFVANYAYQHAAAALTDFPTQYFSPNLAAQFQSGYQTEYIDQFSQNEPTHIASLLLSQRFADNWNFSTGYYFRGVAGVSDVALDVTHENVMHRLDVRLSKTFKTGSGHSAEVAAIVQNMTQDPYTKYGTVNATANVLFSRRGWLTATFDF